MEEQVKAFLRRKHRAPKDQQASAQPPRSLSPPPLPPPPPPPQRQREEGKSERHSEGEGRLSQFLSGIGLEKLQEVFNREEVDFDSLQLLREEDYKDMGIKTGPRLKILNALGRLHSGNDEL
jgi:hypothetical protein